MRWVIAALIAACVFDASAVAAQRRWPGPQGEPGAEDLAEARQLYEAGSRAVEAYRFADGLRLFERSYELSGLGAALFGAAFALQSIGRFRDARDAFAQLLADHPNLPDEYRERALRFRAENEGKVAVLELAGLPVEPVRRVELDGADVPDDGGRPLIIESDPGLRRLRVEADGFSNFDWEGRAGEGEHLRIDVELQPSGSLLWESPWFWVAVGVVVVAGAVVTGIVLYEDAQLTPRTPDHIILCEDC
jgi:tetratricopeptide (TPR) repeat protein